MLMMTWKVGQIGYLNDVDDLVDPEFLHCFLAYFDLHPCHFDTPLQCCSHLSVVVIDP